MKDKEDKEQSKKTKTKNKKRTKNKDKVKNKDWQQRLFYISLYPPDEDAETLCNVLYNEFIILRIE